MNLFSLQLKETFRPPLGEAGFLSKSLWPLLWFIFWGPFVFGASMLSLFYTKVLDREPVEVFNGFCYTFSFWVGVALFLNFSNEYLALILLPFKKRKIINRYCALSFLALIPLHWLFIFLCDFDVSRWLLESGNGLVACSCFGHTLFEFLIYIVNKNNVYFVVLLAFIAVTVALDIYNQIDLGHITGALFDGVVAQPQGGIIYFPIFLACPCFFFFKTRFLYRYWFI